MHGFPALAGSFPCSSLQEDAPAAVSETRPAGGSVGRDLCAPGSTHPSPPPPTTPATKLHIEITGMTNKTPNKHTQHPTQTRGCYFSPPLRIMNIFAFPPTLPMGYQLQKS